MTFEETFQAIQTWLAGIESTLEVINTGVTDGNNIKMPRPKDLILTFPEDASVQPEQMPAIVLEVEGSVMERIAPLKGSMGASLYVADDAKSGSQARIKLIRWIDAIRSHCLSGASVLGPNMRVVPRRESFVMGKAKGDLNAFQLKVDLVISF